MEASEATACWVRCHLLPLTSALRKVPPLPVLERPSVGLETPPCFISLHSTKTDYKGCPFHTGHMFSLSRQRHTGSTPGP